MTATASLNGSHTRRGMDPESMRAYAEEGYSANEISDELGYSPSYIRRRARLYGVTLVRPDEDDDELACAIKARKACADELAALRREYPGRSYGSTGERVEHLALPGQRQPMTLPKRVSTIHRMWI